jgi:glycerate 2-kinase
MPKQWIKNHAQLATTAGRETALALVNAGLNAIDTGQVMASSLSHEGDTLRIQKRKIDLTRFHRIHVIGFGKAAGRAAEALEDLLGPRLGGGVVIGTGPSACRRVQVFQGTHPLPSEANVRASQHIVELAERLTADDLVLVIVSGGGSAMLCWPESECDQGRRLFQDMLQTGAPITELNTVRKHLSALKGGGLAKMLHPATVIGLIFSDVPGDHFESVASGPTYRDETTVADARRILEKYRLAGYELVETPKEIRYFENVTNIPLVSNRVALQAMAARGEAMNLPTMTLSDSLYDPYANVAERVFAAAAGPSAPNLLLAGGEPEVKVPAAHGRGGRNQFLTLRALKSIKAGQVFISFGSDGRDNGDAAGAIADAETMKKALALGLDLDDHLNRFDSQTFFEKTGDLILTGPTEANVSDLMLLLNLKP